MHRPSLPTPVPGKGQHYLKQQGREAGGRNPYSTTKVSLTCIYPSVTTCVELSTSWSSLTTLRLLSTALTRGQRAHVDTPGVSTAHALATSHVPRRLFTCVYIMRV